MVESMYMKISLIMVGFEAETDQPRICIKLYVLDEESRAALEGTVITCLDKRQISKN